MKLFFAIALAVFSVSASAQYRCKKNGTVVYQEESCVPQQRAPGLGKSADGKPQVNSSPGKQSAEKQPTGYEIHIPSDPGATCIVLEVVKVPPDGRMREIVTKRIGRGGHFSFSRRLYDCRYSQVKYLGTGDTLADMDKSSPDQRMSSIVPGSIADYIGAEACKN